MPGVVHRLDHDLLGVVVQFLDLLALDVGVSSLPHDVFDKPGHIHLA